MNPAPVLPVSPEGIVVVHDVIIGKGGNRDLHAEIAYPQGATGSLPAVIFIHGGGWIGGTHRESPIRQLAQNGYFAASIEYRLSNEAKWPAQIEDCKLGVRWLRANSTRYHVDPNRIGVWGASAGAHLAACLGTMADEKEYEGDGGYPGVSSAVQAVVDFYGPTDLTVIDYKNPSTIGIIEALFGASRAQKPDLWRSASPLFHVKAGDPPMLIIHGDSDVTVPLSQSTSFATALTKAAVPHQFVIVKNADHGFKPMPGTAIDPTGAEILNIVKAFFAKYLKTP